jgi:hypothetical protein
VYNRKNDEHFSLSEKDLDRYFIPKKNREITKSDIQKTMK